MIAQSTLGEAIASLLELRKDWDSYGGLPITREAISVVRNWRVQPRPDGGVSFHWNVNDWEVSVDFNGDGQPISYQQERVT